MYIYLTKQQRRHEIISLLITKLNFVFLLVNKPNPRQQPKLQLCLLSFGYTEQQQQQKAKKLKKTPTTLSQLTPHNTHSLTHSSLSLLT